jgi:hypothetical protein
MQDNGSSSHCHAHNQKSSENGLMDDNPWGVGMFANMEIEEVQNQLNLKNLVNQKKIQKICELMKTCLLTFCVGYC